MARRSPMLLTTSGSLFSDRQASIPAVCYTDRSGRDDPDRCCKLYLGANYIPTQ